MQYQTNIKNRGYNKVSLRLANGEMLPCIGMVWVVTSKFNAETANIACKEIFLNNKKLLNNQQTGKVLMTIPLKNALIIPQKPATKPWSMCVPHTVAKLITCYG